VRDQEVRGEGERERKKNKKKDSCVNSATLHVELHYSHMHHK
jgi:hypothetical protein